MNNNNYNIDLQLPSGIKQFITSFLNPEDALAFATTSMNIKEDLGLRVTNNSYGLTNQNWYGGYADGHMERIWFRCIPISQVQIHTIQFVCDFKDQGWGNRKGRLYIREDKSKNNYDGTIVARSLIAEHHKTSLKLTFQPKPGKNYTMCYEVGGGGGHELIVKNPCFRQLLYCDEGVESMRIE